MAECEGVTMPQWSDVMDERRICVIVPTYNNAATVVDVVRRVIDVAGRVIVVADGCTDQTPELLRQFDSSVCDVVSYQPNRGKGYALAAGFKHAISKGYEYAITLDADGQHYPEDIPLFVKALQQHGESLFIGSRNLGERNMPGQNTFANKFSNFWFTLQTGRRLADTQTGYRLYPLRHLAGVRLLTSRYEAELEMLVFAAWRGHQIVSVPIRVYYPPAGQRVTHFRPVADFARISLLNTVLCVLAVFYGWPRIIITKLLRKKNGKTVS